MIQSFEDKKPKLGPDCFVAQGAWVIGDVEMGEGTSLWFQSVIRGDVNSIRIGSKTNIQDLSLVHVTNTDAPKPAPTQIGNEVTIGHRVVIHGCTIGDRCLIGMGTILLDGCVIGNDCLIGAGSLVTPGTVIPDGMMAFGSPAKVVRPLKEQEKLMIRLSAAHYFELSRRYISQGGFTDPSIKETV